MNRSTIALLCGMLMLSFATAHAQQGSIRVRGTIAAFDGKVLAVKSRDGNVTLELPAKVVVVATKAIRLADIKPGDGVGIGAARRPDGTLVAVQVQVFPPERGIPNPGHRSWDVGDDSTMTNAPVTSVVQAAKGRELTLTYKGGSQKILADESAAIYTAVPADSSVLAPGDTVFITGKAGADGKPAALRITVGKDGVKLPQ